MATYLLIALLAVLVLAIVVRELSLASKRGQGAAQEVNLQQHLQALAETLDRRLGDMDTKVDSRLQTASETSNRIHERLGKLGEATVQMNERVKDLARLEQALKPPKARG